MPASPIRHRRRASLAAIVLAVGLLAGCAGQRAPSSYTGDVKSAFIEGCWTTLVSDANGLQDKDGKIPAPADIPAKYDTEIKGSTKECTCAFANIKKDVPFGTFKKLNDQLTENPKQLPSSFTKAYDACRVGEATKQAA